MLYICRWKDRICIKEKKLPVSINEIKMQTMTAVRNQPAVPIGILHYSSWKSMYLK